MQPLEKNQTGILDQNGDAAELTAIILVRSIEEKIDGLEINPGDTGKGRGETYELLAVGDPHAATITIPIHPCILARSTDTNALLYCNSKAE
jgi:hypothetical protein